MILCEGGVSRAGFAKVNGVQQEDSKAEVLRKSVSHACNENGIYGED